MPEAPPSLWDQLDRLEKASRTSVVRPENSFTFQEFKEHTGLCDSASYARLQILARNKKIRKEGRGPHTYYVIL